MSDNSAQPDETETSSIDLQTDSALLEGDHCPHCVVPIRRGEHLCHNCGGPITAHAMIDPLAHIWSICYGYRQLTSGQRRPSRIALIGIWLIFASSICWKLFLCWMWVLGELIRTPELNRAESFLQAFMILLWTIVEFAVLYRVTQNYVEVRDIPFGLDDDTEGSLT